MSVNFSKHGVRWCNVRIVTDVPSPEEVHQGKEDAREHTKGHERGVAVNGAGEKVDVDRDHFPGRSVGSA